MTLLRMVVVALAAVLPLVGGCAQRVVVQGQPEQLYAEAKGALESEGFRTMTCKNDMPGAKGCSKADGRLQFLYYADTIVPTVVEVQIDKRAAEAHQSASPHSVAVSAWSSLTFVPDPWIADLAMGVLRRAYLLSGNLQ